MIQSSSIQIKILGENPQQKGKAFEKLMAIVMEKLGYKDIIPAYHTTGMEIDLEATEKGTNYPVICECKAIETEVDTTELMKFFGKLNQRRSNNKFLKGLFFSISGFNGTALKNYSEMQSHEKEFFEIFDNKKIIELLQEAKIVSSYEDLEKKIRQTTDLTLGLRYMVYFNGNVYLVQIIEIGGLSSNYIIMTSNGELVEKSVRQKISQLDETLVELKEIDLEIMDKIILNLLDLKTKTINEISLEINEVLKDVEVSVKELVHEKFVQTKNDEGYFQIEVDSITFQRILKKLTSHKRQFEMMKTTYVNKMVNLDFINQSITRFKVSLDDGQKNNMLQICKISPSALKTIILYPVTEFENSSVQIENSPSPDFEKEKRRKEMGAYLMQLITQNLREDIPKMTSNYVLDKGILGWHLSDVVRLVTQNTVIDVNTKINVALAIAGGTIKPGELVMGNDNTIFNVAICCMNLKEYQSAVHYFSNVISISHNKELLKQAWFLKGVSLMNVNKHKNAIDSFRQLKEYGENPAAEQKIKKCFRLIKDELRDIGKRKQGLEQYIKDNDFE